MVFAGAAAGLLRSKARAVFTYDLSRLGTLYEHWGRVMPGVSPFYAVKCNPDPHVVQTLAGLGCSFDCASPAEIALALSAGASPQRILYANPCKHPQDLLFASHHNIPATTADTECELEKIAALAPGMHVYLRIYACDPSARCVLSNRFGAHPHEWEGLLATAKRLSVQLTGVSFHVGSGACNPKAFMKGIHDARRLADMASTYGFAISHVDVGGGFSVATLDDIAPHILDSLHDAFPGGGTRFLAEPGRYFAETIASLSTPVLNVRVHPDGRRDYTVFESVYGSFNCILYDHAVPVPEAEHEPTREATRATGSVFGATCDGLDVLATDVALPPLSMGDRILWRNMGAYTSAGASAFNGLPFPMAKRVYEPAPACQSFLGEL